jgi:hypothetical protein
MWRPGGVLGNVRVGKKGGDRGHYIGRLRESDLEWNRRIYSRDCTVIGGVVGQRKKEMLTGGSHLSAGGREGEKILFRAGLPGPRAYFPPGPKGFPGSISLFFFFLFSFLFSYFLYIFFRFGPNCFKSISKNSKNSEE